MLPLKDNLRYVTFPYVTVALVVVNILFYVGQMVARHMGVEESLLHSVLISRDQLSVELSTAYPLTVLHALSGIITPMFLHNDFMHIFGNLCFLFTFAPGVEARMGSKKFLAFYLIAGALAGLAFMMAGTGVEEGRGASGAIAGVLGAYLLLFPRAQVEGLFFSPLPQPVVTSAFIFLLEYFIVQGIGIHMQSQGAMHGQEALTGYSAHLAGLSFGALCGACMAIWSHWKPPAVARVIVPPRPDRPRYLYEIALDLPGTVCRYVLRTTGRAFYNSWRGLVWCVRRLGGVSRKLLKKRTPVVIG